MRAVKRKIPAWKELLVAVAGPAMNIVLAVVLAVVLSLIPSAKFGELTTEIGGFASGSVAKEAGLRAGDIVVSVGGHPVTTWSELQTEVQISNGEPTEFVVRRPVALTEVRTLKLTATDGDFGFVCVTNRHPAVVGGFWGEASVAEKAGLKVGDRIVSFNGACVTSELDLVQEIEDDPTFVGVGAARGYPDGSYLKGTAPCTNEHGYVDATNLERNKYDLDADMCEAYKVSVFRQFPMAEWPGEKFAPEQIALNEIALSGYKLRWYKDIIYVCDYLEDGLTKGWRVVISEISFPV